MVMAAGNAGGMTMVIKSAASRNMSTTSFSPNEICNKELDIRHA